MLADRRAKDGRSGHDLVQDRLDRLLDFRRQVSAYVTDDGQRGLVLVDGLGHCRGSSMFAIARGRTVVVMVVVVAVVVMVVGGDKSCVEVLSYRKYEAPTVAVDSERH